MRQTRIMGVGGVYLAKNERTVIMQRETELRGLSVKYILDRVRAQLPYILKRKKMGN